MRKKVVVIIPARMASTRFPGKPLFRIMNLPMIEHVRRRACLSSVVDEVYVATCDNEIKDVIAQYGGKAIMTADTHLRCTDRVEEAVRKMDADIVAIVQGDEPLFDPAVLEALVRPMLEDANIQCANLLSIIKDKKDLSDMDIVKAVLDRRNYVMYYSRAPMPYFMADRRCPMYRQTGISVFTKTFLRQFSKLPPTSKEVVESIDFLRILEHGYEILGVTYPGTTMGVDRQDDVLEVEKLLSGDPVQREIHSRIVKGL